MTHGIPEDQEKTAAIEAEKMRFMGAEVQTLKPTPSQVFVLKITAAAAPMSQEMFEKAASHLRVAWASLWNGNPPPLLVIDDRLELIVAERPDAEELR